MRFIVLAAAMVAASFSVPAAARDAEVYVLGALHGLHEKEESFSYETLGAVIAAIRPDVMLLEVTPEELAERKDTPGRPEYPKVIWPMLTTDGPRAYAMEAAQPAYGEMTGAAGAAWKTFAAELPEESAALDGYNKSVSALLLAHWKSVADTQDDATAALGETRNRIEAAMVEGSDAVQHRWDGTMIDASKKVIAENPGKRILVLGSYRNRYMFVEELGGLKGAKLVDMRAWLGSNGFGGGSQ